MSPTDKSTKDGPKVPESSKVQGEGDYDAARRFDEDAKRFLQDADVPELARRAAPKSEEEAAELEKAEAIGRAHRARNVPKR